MIAYFSAKSEEKKKQAIRDETNARQQAKKWANASNESTTDRLQRKANNRDS